MKKTYKKPQIFVESFELAQHIAGCNLTLTNLDVTQCSATGELLGDNSEAWFVSANTNCKTHSESYCYTNGTLTSATINS